MDDIRLLIFFVFWYQLMCVAFGFGTQLAIELVRILRKDWPRRTL